MQSQHRKSNGMHITAVSKAFEDATNAELQMGKTAWNQMDRKSVLVRMPYSVHQHLKEAAFEAGMSLTMFMEVGALALAYLMETTHVLDTHANSREDSEPAGEEGP